jgi:hypothetical protein
MPYDNEPYETMESVQVGDIDDYLDAILKNYKHGNHGHTHGSGVNFMMSPKNSNI